MPAVPDDDQIKSLAWRTDGCVAISPRHAVPCHKPTMEAEYRIVPCRHKYWIEARAHDGSYRRRELYNSEDEAIQRLRVLRQEAELAERRATAVPPKVIVPACTASTVHKPTNSAASATSTGSMCAVTASKRMIAACGPDARVTETGSGEKMEVDEMLLGGTARPYIASTMVVLAQTKTVMRRAPDAAAARPLHRTFAHRQIQRSNVL